MYEYNKQGTSNPQLGIDYNMRLRRDYMGLHTIPLERFKALNNVVTEIKTKAVRKVYMRERLKQVISEIAMELT